MDLSLVKLVALAGFVLVLWPLGYVGGRAVSWGRPLTMFVLAMMTISLHYCLVQYSISDDTTVALLTGIVLLIVVAMAAWAFSPATCLATLRRLALIVAYPTIAYLLVLALGRQNVDENGFFVGFTENSNMMGGYIALLIFPAVAQSFFDSRGFRRRLAPFLMLVASLFLIFLTASRASLIAIIAGVAFVTLATGAVSRKLRILIITGLLVSPVILSPFINKYEDVGVLSSRLLLYQLRFESISERPWTGWGLAADVDNSYDRFNMFPPQEKGNTILQMGEEFGVVLAVLFTVTITAAIVVIGRRLAANRATAWVAFFLVAAWVHSMFETWMFNFESVQAIFFWATFMFAAFAAPRSGLPALAATASDRDRSVGIPQPG